MVKARFSTVDVLAETACLRQRLLGMRVANIYSTNDKASCQQVRPCCTVCAVHLC